MSNDLDVRLEQARRIGFACGQIAEALGFLEDCEKSAARYWAYKALTRANDVLREGKVT